MFIDPPDVSTTTGKDLNDLLNDISKSNERIIFGDCNLPVASWGIPISSHSGHSLYDSLLESALNQYVNKPTRGDNISDLIFSTNDALVSNVNVGPVFSTSDHKIVKFDIDLKIYEENISEELVYVYSKEEYEKLKSTFPGTDWSQISSITEINVSWTKFADTLNTAVESVKGVREIILNQRGRIIKGTGLLNKNRAYRKYLLPQDENDNTEYEIFGVKIKSL